MLLAKRESRSYNFWFRKKFSLTPNDPRFLDMEPWEIELEFHTYEEFERAASGQSEFQRVEEVVMDEELFKKEIAKFSGDQLSPNDWEEVK